MDNQFYEETLRSPVKGEYDVIVAGGGPAGISAAISAARNGARVLVIERYGFFGGTWTAGLVTPFFDTENKGGLVRELIQNLDKRGAWGGWSDICFDYEQLKLILDEMIVEAGVHILFHSYIAGTVMSDADTVSGIIVENKAGRSVYRSKVVIDCTGDGVVAHYAGAPYWIGRQEDNLTQPMTLMFRIGNVDFNQDTCDDLYELLQKAVQENNLDYEIPYSRPYILMLPGLNSAAVQITHMRMKDPLNPDHLSQSELEGRQQISRTMDVFQNYISELKGVTLEQIASQSGVRESRRIQGDYCLTVDDLVEGKRFNDGIALCGFNVDIHNPGDSGQIVYPCGIYHIPFRCLVPVQTEGLLIAGRCISGTYEAHASYRVTGNCMAMGEAAGAAAALSVQLSCKPRNIDIGVLQDTLKKQGVIF